MDLCLIDQIIIIKTPGFRFKPYPKNRFKQNLVSSFFVILSKKVRVLSPIGNYRPRVQLAIIIQIYSTFLSNFERLFILK